MRKLDIGREAGQKMVKKIAVLFEWPIKQKSFGEYLNTSFEKQISGVNKQFFWVIELKCKQKMKGICKTSRCTSRKCRKNEVKRTSVLLVDCKTQWNTIGFAHKSLKFRCRGAIEISYWQVANLLEQWQGRDLVGPRGVMAPLVFWYYTLISKELQ